MANREFDVPRYSSNRPYGDRDYGWPGRARYERVTPDYPEFPRARADRREWSSTEGWRVPGPYIGRGPKGYQRSDERICEEINERLTAHSRIDATDIECQVQDGEAVLSGYVDSRATRRAAADVAEDVYGVRDVRNQLRVRTHAGDEGVGRTSVLGITEAQMPPGRPR